MTGAQPDLWRFLIRKHQFGPEQESVQMLSDEEKPISTVELRCADCGTATKVSSRAKPPSQDLKWPCPKCGGTNTSVGEGGEKPSSSASTDVTMLNPMAPFLPFSLHYEDDWSSLKNPRWPGSSSASPPEKKLPEPSKTNQICRECGLEFAPSPNHVGFINVCPECRTK